MYGILNITVVTCDVAIATYEAVNLLLSFAGI